MVDRSTQRRVDAILPRVSELRGGLHNHIFGGYMSTARESLLLLVLKPLFLVIGGVTVRLLIVQRVGGGAV